MSIVQHHTDHLRLTGYIINEDGNELVGPEPPILDYPAFAVFQELASQGLAGRPGEEACVTHRDFMAYAEKEDILSQLYLSLRLPPPYSGPMYIQASGPIGTAGSNLIIRFPDAITQHGPIGDKKLGRYGILLSDSQGKTHYTCTPALFKLLQAIDAYNAGVSIHETKDELLRKCSQVTKLTEEVQARLDPVLESEKILEPGKISVQLLEENGEVSLIPDTEVLDLPSGTFGEKFNKRFDVPMVYSFDRSEGGRIRLVLPEPKRKALEIIKRDYQKIRDPRQFRKLLENPPIEFDEAELDVSELYSDRVKGLGIYRPKAWPFICPYETEWIPGIMVEEDGIKTPLPVKTDEDIQSLQQAIEEAERTGKDFVTYQGAKIDLDTAKKVLHAAQHKKDGSHETAKQASEKYSLIIEENIESLGYIEQTGVDEHEALDFEVPGLAAGIVLKDYQRQGVARMLSLYRARNPGLLVADDMGLGKTLQALSFLEILGNTEAGIFACIVAPKSLVGNWKAEYEKFFPNGVLLLENAIGNTGLIQHLCARDKHPHNVVVLFSYETLRIRQLDLCALPWDVAILDEAQRIKTVGTLITNAAKALKARFKIAMTGTPVENTFHDLWCITDFCLPGFLGSAKDFASKYNVSTQEAEEQIRMKGDALRGKLGHNFIRRIKEEVLTDLPPKYESDNPEHAEKFGNLSTIKIMPGSQHSAYDSVITEYLRVRGNMKDKRGILDILHKLKQACEHPSFVKNNASNLEELPSAEDSAKTVALVEIIDKIRLRNEKVIVFAEYRRTQRYLAALIHEVFNIRPEIINGDTPAGIDTQNSDRSRLGIVKKFNEKKGFDVIIMSPVAAGVGLNVTGANHVIHFSRHWNPAKEDQATDRAYRIGQKKPVYVYYLIARHPDPKIRSFDDNLARLIFEKRKLRGAVLYPVAMREVKPEEILNASLKDVL